MQANKNITKAISSQTREEASDNVFSAEEQI